MAMPNVTVPEDYTTFLCQPMYSNFSEVRHIIKIGTCTQGNVNTEASACCGLTHAYDVRTPSARIPNRCIPLLPAGAVVAGGFGASSSKGLVHHMLLYGCASPPPITNATFECDTMPASCQEITYAWVPGGGEWNFPPEAAVPVGGSVSDDS
jgi:hypothetical protein